MASHVIAKFVGECSVRFENEFSVTGRIGKPGLWEQVAEACCGARVLHLNQGNLTGRALLFSTNSFVYHWRDLAGVYHDLHRSSARFHRYSAVPGCTRGAADFAPFHERNRTSGRNCDTAQCKLAEAAFLFAMSQQILPIRGVV
jgi:hypothetical protein